mgnify:CR=1 FL=1
MYIKQKIQWLTRSIYRVLAIELCTMTSPSPSLKRRGNVVVSPPLQGGAGGGRRRYIFNSLLYHINNPFNTLINIIIGK